MCLSCGGQEEDEKLHDDGVLLTKSCSGSVVVRGFDFLAGRNGQDMYDARF
jgi:hypothetical protein